MRLTEIVAPTMKELFIKEITSLILSGQLKPGDKMLTERDMASQMKVSRTIVNLGMCELADMGFVEIIPRKGAYVADYIRNGKLDTLISVVNFNGGKFDKATLNSIMQFRLINECEAVSLAATNRTEKDIAIMQDILAQLVSETDSREIARLVFRFHHSILCASGNNIFPLVYNAFESILINIISSFIDNRDSSFTYHYFDKILFAIEYKQADNAKALIKDLLTMGMTTINEHYDDWLY